MFRWAEQYHRALSTRTAKENAIAWADFAMQCYPGRANRYGRVHILFDNSTLCAQPLHVTTISHDIQQKGICKKCLREWDSKFVEITSN